MGSVGSRVLCQGISAWMLRFISISSLLVVPRLSEYETTEIGDKQVLSWKTNMEHIVLKHWGQMADALSYDLLWLHFRLAAFSDNPTYCIRVRVPQQHLENRHDLWPWFILGKCILKHVSVLWLLMLLMSAWTERMQPKCDQRRLCAWRLDHQSHTDMSQVWSQGSQADQ